MTGRRGLTLIEVVVVLAIIGLSLGLAGPRIGAGLGRLELNASARTVSALLKTARLQAQRTDRQQYVVLDKARRSVTLVNADLQVVREEEMPSSIEIVLPENIATSALYVAPSGLIRGAAVRLRSRVGETEISLR